MTTTLTRLTLAAAAAATLAGCTLAPTYHRPDAPVAQDWPADAPHAAQGAATSQVAAADIGWRDFFADARLQALITLALQNNRDLRVATLQVEKARAQYQIQRADLFPSIAASAAGTRARTPGDLNGLGRATVGNDYSAGLGFTAYELDLFGRVRSLKNEALETYFSTLAAQRSAQITLVSGVASQYLSWLGAQAQVQLAQGTLASYERSLALTQRSFEVGASSALDLAAAETARNTAQTALAASKLQAAQAEHALVVLIGQPLPAELPTGGGLDAQRLLTDLPAGLPSDLLERRPDILQAEHTLKAANADIGAARAAFFPRITLTGSYGTASAAFSDLFRGGQGAWSFGPSISLPIFAGGANLANLRVSEANKKIAVAQYEKAIQTAFQEVSDALSGRALLDEQLTAQQALVQSEGKRYLLSEARAQRGVDSALTLLDAERSLFNAQQSLITLRVSRLNNLVTLYKALGGGWTEQSAAAAPSPETTPAS
ncbi:efflux transporter outer membrane subunit [Ralstonia insidiosa]|uniref:Efflux transporter outer membrane subunit n=1 Tax=Ralstonia insidiosa TaxID=190721 RepID=A0A848PAA1_9RALS|nr:efflux transporter outer membrane subunit [Ralstonia insidiosa]NMV42143.1 efflux transporter outer membrane subunit [Ralstonia insidiosa]